MQNAALYLHPEAFDTTTGRILGRHAAGETFLQGFLRHADVDRFDLWDGAGKGRDTLEAFLQRFDVSRRPVRIIGAVARAELSDPGVVFLPGPDLNREAWLRRVVGSRTYAACGLTHTTATAQIMRTIADLLIAPVEDYDALICTSTAVHASVESQLDGVREYLTREFGPRRRAEPQRVVIPLGVNTADFAVTDENRQAWRARLGIPEDAVVALYVGRFNVLAKMNPALMAMALELAAKATGQPIYWVNSGWAESEADAETYHRETRALCPSVTYIEVDGRDPDARFSIWSVADFFISFSDNIQETFGLTPIEAMAAGLPCVVTDWNGYKDTVRNGQDGFRISTTAPRPGMGGDIAFWFANDWSNYLSYVGAAAQYVAIDFAEAVTAISALVQSPDLRRRMGENARARARSVFDWSAIVPQYQALWAEQDARRRAAPPEPAAADNPFRPDPYRLFSAYPTRHLGLEDRLSLAAGATEASIAESLARPLASYARINRPTPAEVAAVVTWLAGNPGACVAELVEGFPQARRSVVRRGLLWMARHGVLEISPAR
ncbi:MAG: glycosyltransferase family 4 protein [Phenylobacterium sp.]